MDRPSPARARVQLLCAEPAGGRRRYRGVARRRHDRAVVLHPGRDGAVLAEPPAEAAPALQARARLCRQLAQEAPARAKVSSSAEQEVANRPRLDERGYLRRRQDWITPQETAHCHDRFPRRQDVRLGRIRVFGREQEFCRSLVALQVLQEAFVHLCAAIEATTSATEPVEPAGRSEPSCRWTGFAARSESAGETAKAPA